MSDPVILLGNESAPASEVVQGRVPMRIIDYFDRLYVINLPERTDRRKVISVELGKAGLIDTAKVRFFPACKMQEADGFPSIGAHGCFLSHLSILREAAADGLRNVLIVEDDLEISPGFAAAEPALVARLARDDWAIAYLGHSDPPRPDPHEPLAVYEGLLYMAHFYGVRGPHFAPLIEELEAIRRRPPGDPLGGRMHFDAALSHYRANHPAALTLVTYPNLGTQRRSRSDISPSWFDKRPLLRPVVDTYRWLRRLSTGR
jgi:hypothetical protein